LFENKVKVKVKVKVKAIQESPVGEINYSARGFLCPRGGEYVLGVPIE